MTIAAAMILDALFGEPDWLWRRLPHPAVLVGRLIGWLDSALNRGAAQRIKGAFALALALTAALAAALLIRALPLHPLPEIIAGAVLLAQRSLSDHVGDVARALRSGLDEGRNSVAMIVGRKVDALDEPGVARAAIESAAENLSDGVVAPLFWFALGGLPGLAAYKALNTADSMIGYRTDRHREFGWAAARLDDLANFIPARLTALLIAIAHGGAAPMRAALRDARLHRSPNAGWPEAAMAAHLGVALSGPRLYDEGPSDDPFVYPEGRRDAGPHDIERARRMLWRVWALCLVFAILVAVLG